jgi:uncharacterized protein GlcG (DUF336 family)
MKIRHGFSLALGAACAMLAQGNASAQVTQGNFTVPFALAVKAATTAITTCASSGYRVSAAVLDMSGTVLLEAKGDRSTIHTTATAERKAYTVITFGPIFQLDASSAFADLVAKNPSGATLAATPGVVALPEAQAGVASIQADISSLSRGAK